MTIKSAIGVSAASLAASIALLPLCTAAGNTLTDPTVRYDTRHDISAPLRDMVRIARHGPAAIEMPEPRQGPLLPKGQPGVDTAAQPFYLPTVHMTPVLSFDAVRFSAHSSFVPDTNGAAGSTQFVEITNYQYAVYDKSGNNVLPPTTTDTIFTGFGGRCEATPPGDPVVMWDKLAGRWFLSYMSFYTKTYALCIAVSTTSDATGSYSRYEYDYDTLPDYPKFAVWPDAYYGTSNITIAGAEPCAYDREAMLAGNSAAAICFVPDGVFSPLPSDLDGTKLPPKGAPNHYVQLGDSDHLQEFDFHVNFAHPGKSTFSGPNDISVPAYSETCYLDCIPQPNGGETLEALADRLLYRLAYRNFGDHESMVVAHAVLPGGRSTAVAAMRWYELRASPVGSAFALYQAGTFQNRNVSLWMGSTAMDRKGNIALGMSASSDAKDPSIWYTGRLASDPLGKMENPTIAVKGTAIEAGDESRWGDYSSMSIDPADDCTFWYSQMYYNKKHGGTASGDWDTHITAFKFDNCR